MTIKHDNIIYARNINVIGGVETYVYELIKKYKDKDIAVVCETIAPKQKERLEKMCKVYIHKDQKIECKVIITNWDTSIVEYVNKDAKVYTGLHTDYSHPSQQCLPVDNPRITYIGITEISKQNFQKMSKIKDDRVILCRNPLSIKKRKKPLVLMSATRLTKEKGGKRMLALANELDRQGIEYVWFVFTSNEYPNDPVWKNDNVIKMDNRLDLDYFYSLADWYVQLSEVEGDSYSIREALYRNIPIVACELSYFKEYDITDGKNAIFMELDSSNVEDVAKRMQKKLIFNFEPIKDDYDKIIVDGKSHYEEDKKMKVKVEALKEFEGIRDAERNVFPKAGDTWICSKERAELLEENGYVKVLGEIKEEIKIVEAPKVAKEIYKPKKTKLTKKK